MKATVEQFKTLRRPAAPGLSVGQFVEEDARSGMPEHQWEAAVPRKRAIRTQTMRHGVQTMRLLAVTALVAMLTGCGTLVGAGAGGYAGNQVGHGTGKSAATAGGGALGHALTGD
jgi:outer membrane lipoprotein SlyB